MRIRTHYDNLKVSRDAPQEVIRAAYRILSQKYHPDRNKADLEASRIMTIINASYAILSDPAKRAAHDSWIEHTEVSPASVQQDERTGEPPLTPEKSVRKDASSRPTRESHNPSSGGTFYDRRKPVAWGLFIVLIVFSMSVKKYFFSPSSGVATNTRNTSVCKPPSTEEAGRIRASFPSWKGSLKEMLVCKHLDGSITYKHLEKSDSQEQRGELSSLSGSQTESCVRLFDFKSSHVSDDLKRTSSTTGSGSGTLFKCTGPDGSVTYRPNAPGSRSAASLGPESMSFVRPERAPNGQPWPGEANYISKYPKLNSNGHSRLTIDNRRNGADVFVKIFQVGRSERPVRHLYIPSGQSFIVQSIASGRYDIRYQDLSSGLIFRSEDFLLEQREVPGGIAYSDISVTLYKIRDGNMETVQIDKSSFE